jgi:hypothetical protein
MRTTATAQNLRNLLLNKVITELALHPEEFPFASWRVRALNQGE